VSNQGIGGGINSDRHTGERWKKLQPHPHHLGRHQRSNWRLYGPRDGSPL